MPKCKIKGCENFTQYSETKNPYCQMHLARIRRHGYPELKRDKGEHGLEKLPHKMVDDFILKNCGRMLDKEIATKLKELGFKEVTAWNVRYRRRKLGVKKYLYGEIKKHKAWIREQAVNKHGGKCELCSYSLSVDAHHITPKCRGGLNEVDNLMIVCPNCHSLITRKIIKIDNRKDIQKVRKIIIEQIKNTYRNLF